MPLTVIVIQMLHPSTFTVLVPFIEFRFLEHWWSGCQGQLWASWPNPGPPLGEREYRLLRWWSPPYHRLWLRHWCILCQPPHAVASFWGWVALGTTQELAKCWLTTLTPGPPGSGVPSFMSQEHPGESATLTYQLSVPLGRKWKWKLCLTLCDLYSPWDSPGQNIGVSSRSLLQGIFPTQGSNPGLPHCRQILYQLSYQGSLLWGEVDGKCFFRGRCISPSVWEGRRESHLYLEKGRFSLWCGSLIEECGSRMSLSLSLSEGTLTLFGQGKSFCVGRTRDFG